VEDKVDRPAGWYYDDDSPTIKKFWDGTSWTGQVAPREMQQSPKPTGADGVMKIALGVAVGLVVVLLGGWLTYGLVTANDDLECSIETANRAVDGLPADC